MVNDSISFGDVYLVDFGGSYNEQNGLRPAIIVQNNVGNLYSPNVIVVPLTSKIKRGDMLTHVVISSKDTDIEKDSMALCENLTTVSKNRLVKYLAKMPNRYMIDVSMASLLSLGTLCCLDIESLESAKEKACRINNINTQHV